MESEWSPESLSHQSGWETAFERVIVWGAYGTLGVATVLDLFAPAPWQERAVTLGIVATAAVWVVATIGTRAPTADERPGWFRVYFVGLVVLALILILRSPTYFVFAITGFFHAYLLRPWFLTFLGVGVTSLVINITIVIEDPNPEAWVTYLIIVVIQTLAIGFGLVGGEKITELSESRRTAVAELEAALEENAGLHAQLVSQAREAGADDERRRMAREIHDTLAQGLTGVVTQLEAAQHSIGDAEALGRHLRLASRLGRETLTEARRSVHALGPQALEHSRLVDALGDVSARWSEINGVTVDVSTTGTVRPLHPDVEIALLRVAQEGLANVARHSRASRAGVSLSFLDDVVTLDIRDNGVGFDPGNGGSRAGFGLTAMRQRVEGLDGQFHLESRLGSGTAVSVAVPALEGDASDGT